MSENPNCANFFNEFGKSKIFYLQHKIIKFLLKNLKIWARLTFGSVFVVTIQNQIWNSLRANKLFLSLTTFSRHIFGAIAIGFSNYFLLHPRCRKNLIFIFFFKNSPKKYYFIFCDFFKSFLNVLTIQGYKIQDWTSMILNRNCLINNNVFIFTRKVCCRTRKIEKIREITSST